MSNGHIHVRYLSTTSKCGCSHVVCMTVVAGDIGADSYFILQYISINFLHPMSVIWHVSCLTHLSKTSPSVQNVPPAMSVSHVELKKVPCVSIGCLCQPFVKNVSVCRKRASSHISCAVKLKSPCLSIRCLCVSAIYLSGLGICRAFGPWAWTPSARRACLRSGAFGQNTRRAGPLARTNIWGLQKILLLTNGNVPSSSPLDV